MKKLILIGLLGLVGCGKGDSPAPEPEPARVFEFKIANVTVRGIAADAASVASEKAKAETAVKLAK